MNLKFLKKASKEPDIKTLKKNKKSLSEEEREIVKKKGGEWNDGSSAIIKSEVNGNIWYTTYTHRAYQTFKSLDAAINGFNNFIKSTASVKQGLNKKANREIYMMHVKSRDPELGEVEYWKSGPRRYDARPKGWKDCLGSIVQFQDSYILVDDPDDELYPTVEDGIHALVKQHEKHCKEQRSKDWRSIFAGGGTPINLRSLRKQAMKKEAIAKGHVLMEIEHAWDDPDLIVDFGIKVHALENFLKSYGKSGAQDLKDILEHLKSSVDEYLESASEYEETEK